jgi:hypothetical protein
MTNTKPPIGRRRGVVTDLLAKPPKPVNKRGQGIELVVRSTFDSDGKRHAGTVNFEPVKQRVAVNPASTEQATEATIEVTTPRRKRQAKPRAKDQAVPLENLKWLTIAQTALRYPAFSEKSLRHLQTQAENYQRYPKAGLRSNGFIECIVRPAGQRKILINVEKFEQWLRDSAVAGK